MPPSYAPHIWFAPSADLVFIQTQVCAALLSLLFSSLGFEKGAFNGLSRDAGVILNQKSLGVSRSLLLICRFSSNSTNDKQVSFFCIGHIAKKIQPQPIKQYVSNAMNK